MLLQTSSSSETLSLRNATSSSTARWILLLAALWCVAWFIHSWHYWEDDAYIHLEYARSVSQGQGYSFGGMRVNGDTSPLWVLLLVGVHAAVPDWLVAGKLLTALGAVFALSGTYFFAMRLAQGLRGSDTFAASMVLLLVTNPYFCYWAFSGMEALTAAGVAFWATYAATTEKHTWRSFLAGCLLAGIAPVLRPEMIFFTALIALLLFAQWWRLAERGLATKKLPVLLLGALLVIAPLLLWSAYALHAFGHVVPNTNAAKRASAGQSVVKRLLNVYSLGFPLILAEIAGLAAWAVVRPSAVRKAFGDGNLLRTVPVATWLFLVWSLITTAFYIVNHTWVQTRYIFVAAPGLMFAMLAFNYRRLPKWVYRLSFAAPLAAAVVMSTMSTWLFVRNKGLADQAIAQIAMYLRSELPPDAPVGVYSIGELAFVSEHPIVDVGGITRPGVIPYLVHPSEAVVQWAKAEGAKYYISPEAPEPGAVLVYSRPIPETGWSLNYRHYSRSNEMRLWKLTDAPAKVPPPPAG
jgi:hypothetical protein